MIIHCLCKAKLNIKLCCNSFKDEISGCNEIINGVCNFKIDNTYSDIKTAKKQCVEKGGYLPRLVSDEDLDLIRAFAFPVANLNPIWTSLTTETSP